MRLQQLVEFLGHHAEVLPKVEGCAECIMVHLTGAESENYAYWQLEDYLVSSRAGQALVLVERTDWGCVVRMEDGISRRSVRAVDHHEYQPQFPERFNWDHLESRWLSKIAEELATQIAHELKQPGHNRVNVPGLRFALGRIAGMADVL